MSQFVPESLHVFVLLTWPNFVMWLTFTQSALPKHGDGVYVDAVLVSVGCLPAEGKPTGRSSTSTRVAQTASMEGLGQ